MQSCAVMEKLVGRLLALLCACLCAGPNGLPDVAL